jgi:hypothetical protein
MNLYLFGSEGLNVCHECEMKISEFVYTLAHTANRAWVDEIKKARRVLEG